MGKLPFETYWTDYSPTQPRWNEPIQMIYGIAEDSTCGLAVITSNNRLLWIGGTFSWYYGFDSSNPWSQTGGGVRNFARLDC